MQGQYTVRRIDWNERETHATGTADCPEQHTGTERWCQALAEALNAGLTGQRALNAATLRAAMVPALKVRPTVFIQGGAR